MFSYYNSGFRFTIWYNDAQDAWLVQEGYSIISKAKTLAAAKANATKIVNKRINGKD